MGFRVHACVRVYVCAHIQPTGRPARIHQRDIQGNAAVVCCPAALLFADVFGLRRTVPRNHWYLVLLRLGLCRRSHWHLVVLRLVSDRKGSGFADVQKGGVLH